MEAPFANKSLQIRVAKKAKEPKKKGGKQIYLNIERATH